MKTELYLLIIEGDTEPDISEPFANESDRDDAAMKHKDEHGDDDGIFALDIVDGKPTPIRGDFSTVIRRIEPMKSAIMSIDLDAIPDVDAAELVDSIKQGLAGLPPEELAEGIEINRLDLRKIAEDLFSEGKEGDL